MYHGVCLKVLDVVYMCRQDVYKKLFQLATGHFETSAKERFVYIEASGIRTLLYHVIVFKMSVLQPSDAIISDLT